MTVLKDMVQDTSLTQQKRIGVFVALVIGVFVFLIALYHLANEVYFVHNGAIFDTRIIEVRSEFIATGKSRVFAYIPIVGIPDSTGSILKTRVDTFSEEPVYRIGEKVQVLCDLSSRRCIENDFKHKWGDFILVLAVSLVFLSIPLFFYWRFRREQAWSRFATDLEGP